MALGRRRRLSRERVGGDGEQIADIRKKRASGSSSAAKLLAAVRDGEFLPRRPPSVLHEISEDHLVLGSVCAFGIDLGAESDVSRDRCVLNPARSFSRSRFVTWAW